MSSLSEHFEKLYAIKSTTGYTIDQWAAVHRESVNLITILCFSSSTEIKDFIKKIDLLTPEDWEKNFAVPPWIRLLAFRLLVSKNPQNKEYKKWAVTSLGPMYEEFGRGGERENNFLE